MYDVLPQRVTGFRAPRQLALQYVRFVHPVREMGRLGSFELSYMFGLTFGNDPETVKYVFRLGADRESQRQSFFVVGDVFTKNVLEDARRQFDDLRRLVQLGHLAMSQDHKGIIDLGEGGTILLPRHERQPSQPRQLADVAMGAAGEIRLQTYSSDGVEVYANWQDTEPDIVTSERNQFGPRLRLVGGTAVNRLS